MGLFPIRLYPMISPNNLHDKSHIRNAVSPSSVSGTSGIFQVQVVVAMCSEDSMARTDRKMFGFRGHESQIRSPD